MREFATGATRNPDEGKLNYTGFLNPFVVKRFAEFMHRNRRQSDGNLRAADNWQKGIPRQAYMESLERHFMEVKLYHHSEKNQSTWDSAQWGIEEPTTEQFLDALMAIIFNAQGMALEIMKGAAIEEAA